MKLSQLKKIKIGPFDYSIKQANEINSEDKDDWCGYYDEPNSTFIIRNDLHKFFEKETTISYMIQIILNQLSIELSTQKLRLFTFSLQSLFNANYKLIDFLLNKSDIPKVIKIFGFDYKITVKDKIEYQNQTDNEGLYDVNNFEILVQKCNHVIKFKETLFHELVHACDAIASGFIQDLLMPESEINRISVFIFMVIQDNPDFLKYIIS